MDANSSLHSTCNIQVLLQAAEFLERREREAEHGYASMLPFDGDDGDSSNKKHKQKNKKMPVGSSRSVHNELEKHRRAQLRHCLEQLKQQVPMTTEDSVRNTTLNLLRRAELHIKTLQQQDEVAEGLKGRLLWEQRELRLRLEQLQGAARMRNDSMGSARSSERSDSDREDVEVDVESMVFECLDSDELGGAHADMDHCYSSPLWL